ncbi:Rs1 [Symbiodinium natans]|uniref:Rs1 protein n=1 Tax=Symbiodinium natans TaxID=878477 RepID=A0A812J5V2_9DINO|nr:Rs1 [Symbiodinium natans]
MAPSKYAIQCDKEHSITSLREVTQRIEHTLPSKRSFKQRASEFRDNCDKDFVFDSIHGIGFYKGHPELLPTGQLSLNVGPSFVQVFDDMGRASTPDGVLKVHLKCRIAGMFPDSEFNPISAKMDIVVMDSTCWVEETIPCATETKRIKECSSMTTCVHVDAQTWLERGTYCPVGYDVDRGSMTYLKEGKTPKENIYLRKFKDGLDDVIESCGEGKWMLQEKHADDFQSPGKGVFQFAGPIVGCRVTSVSFTGLPCQQPGNITEEEVDVQPMVLDDPNTRAPADYWLHPCDCAGKDWGDNMPVDPAVFALLPPESPDDFIPSPLDLVVGQFVCPPGSMIGDGPIYETETQSAEMGDCELQCKNDEDCHFFWHGKQLSTPTCRLYSACEHLLREPGLEGVLKAVPKSPLCMVSNPEACWSTRLRRYALTTSVPQGYEYWNLHAECDYMLLLGGWGVQSCTRPSLRELKSHEWQHKRQLPLEFKHGTKLEVTGEAWAS